MKLIFLIFIVLSTLQFQQVEVKVDTELIEFDQRFHQIIASIDSVVEDKTLSYIIYEKSAKYEFDPILVARQIMVESRGDSACVQRKTKAVGLMQILPSTILAYGFDQTYIFNRAYNVDCGLRVLWDNREKYGSFEKALACYHGGTKRARQWPHGDQGKTRHYINQIIGG